MNIAFNHFVVVLEFRLQDNQDNGLKANFLTCYPASEKTQRKLYQSPWWPEATTWLSWGEGRGVSADSLGTHIAPGLALAQYMPHSLRWFSARNLDRSMVARPWTQQSLTNSCRQPYRR